MIFLRTVSRTKIGKKLKSGRPFSPESRNQTKNLNQSKMLGSAYTLDGRRYSRRLLYLPLTVSRLQDLGLWVMMTAWYEEDEQMKARGAMDDDGFVVCEHCGAGGGAHGSDDCPDDDEPALLVGLTYGEQCRRAASCPECTRDYEEHNDVVFCAHGDCGAKFCTGCAGARDEKTGEYICEACDNAPRINEGYDAWLARTGYDEACANVECSGINYGEVKNGFCNNCRPCECGECDIIGGSCNKE
jgi:hypothetical protein